GGEVAADAAEGRHGIHDKQGAMVRRRRRDRVQVVDRAARRLAVHDADHGNVWPADEGVRDAARGYRAVKGDLDLDDLPRVAARQVTVTPAEHARYQVEHHVVRPDQ